MHKTHSSIHKFIHQNNNHSKTTNKFVLLNTNRQLNQNYHSKSLNLKQPLIKNTHSSNTPFSSQPSYAHKKSILLTLNQPNQNQLLINALPQNTPNDSPQKNSISTQPFLKSKLTLNHKYSAQSISNNFHDIELLKNDKKIEKMKHKLDKFTNKATFFNQKVQNTITNFKLSHPHRQPVSQVQLPIQKNLTQRIKQAHLKGQRVISVLTMKRYGLRIRLKQCFVQVCVCQKNLHQNEHRLQKNERMSNLVRQMLSISNSQTMNLYYFHLNKEPLVSSNQLPISQSVVIASLIPVLNIENEFHFKIYEEAQRINLLIKQAQLSIGIKNYSYPKHSNFKTKSKSLYHKKTSNYSGDDETEEESTEHYDWQKISNVNNFVELVVDNPEHLKSLNTTSEKHMNQKEEIRSFYNQNYDIKTKTQTGQNFRNPLLEDHSHYHVELSKKKMLNVISKKLQNQNFIKNEHIIKRPTIEALIEQDKRQKQKQAEDIKNPNIIKRNIKNTQKSKKSIIRLLDQKNPLLFEQNIPYLLDKYGINRYEIHNLFTIYKTLEKISGMKFKDEENAKKILTKGIDRGTFDEGMKRLDINPGQEVIKNICYFDDFISWQHFLKIVSIGLRKTPQEKLQAILIGIGGTNKGSLSRNQISLMIGNSLNKIFDSQQNQLKEYFTQMAMKDLDVDGSGIVDVEEIKNKCLTVGQINSQNGQSMDLITFLLLNS